MSASHVQLLSEPRPEAKHTRWLELVRMEVDFYLRELFEEKKEEMRQMSPPTLELVAEIEALTLRGGKRLRPAVAAAGYRSIRPGHGMDRLLELSASLELLQSYLLIHDDWMDGDEVRRGGPSVHASLQQSHHDAHLGNALGVLAGDLAGAYAWELFLRVPYPMQSWPRASALFLSTQKQVYCGQQLDLTGDQNVARMHALKTTSYTVRGPLLLGAMIGHPTDGQLRSLERWASPLGEAFQIRDDLLGALGSSKSTGKPGLDLPHGKLTSVLEEARRSTKRADREPIEAIVGRRDAAQQDLMRAQAFLHESGVVDRLEQRIAKLRDEAMSVLMKAPFNAQGRDMLEELTDELTMRLT